MRTMLVVLIVFAALPAAAADGRWTAAPVPAAGGGDHVMPAARAGRSTGPDHDAPFSGIPSRSAAANGVTSSNKVNGVKTPDVSAR